MHYRRIVNQVVVGVAVAVLASAARAEIVHVYPGNSIQNTINVCVDGDEIIVHPGTYVETINFWGKELHLHSSVGAAVTIIHGGGSGPVVRCINGEGPGTVLEGFTITGGNADFGGGMYNGWYCSPTVTNCTFSGNTAGDSGGGMYNHDSSPTVTDCTFEGNTASQGCGMYNYNSSPTVTNCKFSGNTADFGGGMYNHYNSGPTVTECTFQGNTAGDFGGGMLNQNSSSPTVTNCTFSGNSAWEGGGMCNTDSSPTVTESTFCGNSPDHIYGSVELGGQIDMNAFCPIPVCPGDTTGDGEVNVLDFLELLGYWGTCP